MARMRALRAEFFTSQTLAKVSRDARYLFEGLWIEADDSGRLVDNVKLIVGAVFPWDDDVTSTDVELWLKDLERIGAIERYAVDGGNYIHIVAWSRHQKPQHPIPSTLPAPPESHSPADSEHQESGSRVAHEPLMSDSRVPHEPLMSDSRVPHEPLMSDSRVPHEPLMSGSRVVTPQVRLGQVRSGQGSSGEPPRAPTPNRTGPANPNTPALVERWMNTLRPRARTSLERIKATAVVEHLQAHISDQAIDECIGKIAEQPTEPGSSRYLLAAGRNWASENIPGLRIPDIAGYTAGPRQTKAKARRSDA
jgi:hypothetical protein